FASSATGCGEFEAHAEPNAATVRAIEAMRPTDGIADMRTIVPPNTCAQRHKKLATNLRTQIWCELRRVRCSAWLGDTQAQVVAWPTSLRRPSLQMQLGAKFRRTRDGLRAWIEWVFVAIEAHERLLFARATARDLNHQRVPTVARL